jgi:hypothetical protein
MSRVSVFLGGAIVLAAVGCAGPDPGDCWELAQSDDEPPNAHVTATHPDGTVTIEFTASDGGTCSVVFDPDADTFRRSDVTYRP